MAGHLVFVCDSCDEYAINTKKDLIRSGWEFNPAGKGREIALCAECVRHYAKRRAKEGA